jgi:glycosyltransferase involved in cell wall biosynthesis
MGGGGVQRWLKMVKYIRSFGWEPIIFTVKDGEVSLSDPELLKELPENIETHRAPIWEPFDLYKKLLGKGKNEKIQPGLLNESDKNGWKNELILWIRGNVFVPDAKMFWIKPAVKYLSEYLKENHVDAIVSSGPPHTTHMIAKKIKRKFKTPWLADFRDPWTFVDYYDQLKISKWADRKHHRLEREVLQEADKTVTVTWSWADDFNKKKIKEVGVITNGFDPADFENATGDVPEKFGITHIGSMNKDRNPEILWPVLKELCDEVADFSDFLEIRLIGPVDYQIFKSIEDHGLNIFLRHTAYKAHKDVIDDLLDSALQLLPINNTANLLGVVPGKLFEYIGSKRPILCVGTKKGDAARIITETKAGKVFDYDEKELLKNYLLNAFGKFKSKELKVESEDFLRFSRKELAGKVASTLDEISRQYDNIWD